MKTSIFTIFAIATFCVSASAAGEWGPIQGTLGQSSGAPVQRVPAKTEAQLTELQIEKAIQELPPLYESQSEIFDIFSEDLEMMRKVSEIAQRVESRAQFFNWKNFKENGLLEVWISPMPEDTQTRELKQNFRKNWRCAITKNPNELSDFEIAYMLAETLVRQYAKINAITFPQNEPPQWIVSAIADEALVAQSTGKLQLFKQSIENLEPLPFEKIVEPINAKEKFNLPDLAFRGNAFLLGRVARKRIDDFLLNPAGTLKTLAERTATNDMQLLWAAQFYAAKMKLPAGVETLAQSRERYDEMLIFSIAINNRETQVSAENILPLVSQENTKLIIYRRMAAIANALPTTNPIWHNAFAELAAYYEMLSKPEPQAKLASGTPWAANKIKLLKAHNETLAAQWQRALDAKKLAEKQSNEIADAMK